MGACADDRTSSFLTCSTSGRSSSVGSSALQGKLEFTNVRDLFTRKSCLSPAVGGDSAAASPRPQRQRQLPQPGAMPRKAVQQLISYPCKRACPSRKPALLQPAAPGAALAVTAHTSCHSTGKTFTWPDEPALASDHTSCQESTQLCSSPGLPAAAGPPQLSSGWLPSEAYCNAGTARRSEAAAPSGGDLGAAPTQWGSSAAPATAAQLQVSSGWACTESSVSVATGLCFEPIASCSVGEGGTPLQMRSTLSAPCPGADVPASGSPPCKLPRSRAPLREPLRLSLAEWGLPCNVVQVSLLPCCRTRPANITRSDSHCAGTDAVSAQVSSVRLSWDNITDRRALYAQCHGHSGQKMQARFRL